ncbi:MAG: flagellar filament capping protein FliD, partial [Gemmatimonadaceae bacterium]|nr:flagellar filament capping protein FliD [Gemmatimonadaceae bacterium]
GAAGRSRTLNAGTDAEIAIDGQIVRRARNSVSDAITGVTLALTAAEVGTSVTLQVSRDTDRIVQSMQDFARTYNEVRSFTDANTKSGKRLDGNGSLRALTASLTSEMLRTVTGLTGTFTTAAIAGITHDQNGVLSVATSTFQGYLKTNFDEVRALFAQRGVPSDGEVAFVAATDSTKPRATPYALTITAPATIASLTGAAWTTYATTGTADTMTVSDVATGNSGSIALANGDTIDQAVQRLNALFLQQKMRLTASKTVDNRLKIVAQDYGTLGGATIAYTPGTGNGTAMLGLSAGTTNGIDVAGTINGTAGVGRGQVLTGAAENDAAGLAIRFTGTTARSAGTVLFTTGLGGAISRVADLIGSDGGGSAATQSTQATERATSIGTRINDVQARLDARRAALIKQFVRMESAMVQAQQLTAALGAQLSSLQGGR